MRNQRKQKIFGRDKIYRELANMIAGSNPEERYTTAKTLTIRKCRRLGKL